MVNLLLLIIKMIFGLNVTEKILECTNHVAVEADTDHFYKNLIEIFNSGVPFNIAISDWSEWGDDPVYWGAV